MNRVQDPGEGGVRYRNRSDLNWEDLDEETRKRILSRLEEELAVEQIVSNEVKRQIDSIVTGLDVDEKSSDTISEALSEEQLKTVGKNIPAEIVEEAVQSSEVMGESMSTEETRDSGEFTRAVQEATLIPLFRAVAITGGALSGFLTAAFFIAGGWPLSIVFGVTMAFFIYAYYHTFSE